jgi:hypothetical protein
MNVKVGGHTIGIGWLIALVVFILCLLDIINVWVGGPPHTEAWLTGLLALAMLVG